MSNNLSCTIFLIFAFLLNGCPSAPPAKSKSVSNIPETVTLAEPAEIPKIQNPAKVIHVLVALCDNVNQGIVPVPAFLGNGDDPLKNLYWGAAFGVKTFFSKSSNWTKLVELKNPQENVLERLVFKHKTENVYFIADAYRGSKMRETIDDFFAAASGAKRENILVKNLTLQISGGSNLIAFVGHNGLMDFKLTNQPVKKDYDRREAIILACASRQYFTAPLQKTGAEPLLWTSNLMAPEAYILHDALEGWIKGENTEQIRNRAASAYSKYQKINLKAARNLLVTGW